MVAFSLWVPLVLTEVVGAHVMAFGMALMVKVTEVADDAEYDDVAAALAEIVHVPPTPALEKL